MRNNKGFTLIELLIVVAIIAILAAIAVPNFLEAQVRSKVSRVRADQRSLATAIETYFVDNNQYPAYGYNDQVVTADEIASEGDDFGATFRLRPAGNATGLNSLTSPISYFSSYPSDPFADTRGLTFRYARDRAGWILGSFGPNADQGPTSDVNGDMGWGVPRRGADYNWTPTTAVNDSFETMYSSQQSQPSDNLLTQGTYDPTNGTVSAGDVWRIKD